MVAGAAGPEDGAAAAAEAGDRRGFGVIGVRVEKEAEVGKRSALWGIVVLTVILAGCAGGTKGGEQIIAYANQTGDTAITVSWNCSRAQPNQLVVQGVATDISTAPMQGVAIQVVGIGPDGGQISSGQGFTEEIVLTPTYASPFQVAVNTTGAEKRFHLSYSYQVGATTYASPPQTATTNACPGLP